MRYVFLSLLVLAVVLSFCHTPDAATGTVTKTIAFPNFSSSEHKHPTRPCTMGTMAVKHGTNGNHGTKLYMCLSTASGGKRWYSSTFSNVSAR